MDCWIRRSSLSFRSVARENSRRFARSLLEPSQNDVWVTSAEIPYWWRALPRSWKCFRLVVPWGNFLSTNQKHFQGLGRGTSSVWNICARYSDVVLQRPKWQPRGMSAVFSGYPLRDSRRKRTSGRARNRLPHWNVTCVSSRQCSEPERDSLHKRVTFQGRGRFSRPLAWSFPSTIPERKERLFVVYFRPNVINKIKKHTHVFKVYYNCIKRYNS